MCKWLSIVLSLFVTNAFCTIDVAIKTPEGVVFASDSRVTSDDGSIYSDTYEKIVQVTRFVAVQSAGAASPGNKNLRTTIEDFRWRFGLFDSSSVTVDSVLVLFKQYCDEYAKKGVDYQGFLVGFAGPDRDGAVQYIRFLPGSQTPPQRLQYNVYVVGVDNTALRIIQGIDPTLKAKVARLLTQRCTSDKEVAVSKEYDSLVSLYNVIQGQLLAWSLRDAVDYARMFVEATILTDRLALGQYDREAKQAFPRTGGRILICAVTRSGVQWILPPVLSDQE